MNKEEILAMEAGRELDALVGAKIMGLDIVEDTLTWLPKHYHPDYGRTIFMDVPKYSTNISAAWEVVEKMREKFDWIGIDTVMKDRYRCLIIDRILEGKDKIGEYIADSAPEAICKAALLAVMD